MYRPIRYEGQWELNERQGQGVIIYINGDRLKGHFEQGQPEGVMTYTFATGRERQALFERGERVKWLSVQESAASKAVNLLMKAFGGAGAQQQSSK